MYFEQFYLSCLAHASYMIGSDGIAAVVDPQRDVEIYIEEAAKNGLRIAHIIETHLHADFVSGHRELAARTGAKIHIGAKAGASFPHEPARDGDEIRFGKTVLRFLETPGHTLESMCVLVTDLERGKEPWAVLTGDTLFIGDVGRPDLSPEHTPQQLAGLLYDSLHKRLLTLPDAVEVYPAHGAGSLCGRNISPERRSTIGKERQFNYALRPMRREEFVRMLTADLPTRPEYFRLDAEINRRGAEALERLPELKGLSPKEALAKQAAGFVILDTRPTEEYSACHVPGALHIALSGQYASWAAILLGLDSKIILVAEDPERLQESQMRLARVGIEKVEGFLDGGMQVWEKAGLKTAQVPEISVLDLARAIGEKNGDLQVIDVRKAAEWEAGHIEQARLKPLDQLRNLLSDLDPQRPIAVHCKSGYRSSIATSLLEEAGFRDLMNVTGGFDAWLTQELPYIESRAVPAASTD
ncbi:MAG TPA: rhodanese-like domain-containing protein [Candidatus Acidoferrales bacterium]|nr:rhodanese-like domain-containing protein [Candidatus Acidoferrales bacterium]